MKYFIAYTADNGAVGNVDVDMPYEISSINDIRSIESEIRSDLLRRGETSIYRVAVTNYIRLRDGNEAGTLRQRIAELEAEIERMKEEHSRDTYQED